MLLVVGLGLRIGIASVNGGINRKIYILLPSMQKNRTAFASDASAFDSFLQSRHHNSMNKAEQAIGIFDSGVGGLTVMRAVLELLPEEQLIYLGDTARVPYGNRSPATILQYSREAAHFLQTYPVKMILVACNTVSATALTELQAEASVPVLGTVEPGAHAALQATKTGVIGVLGTSATIRSEAYPKAIRAKMPQAQVFGLACPLWVPLIEENWLSPEDPIVVQVIERYLKQLRAQSIHIDTVVLGCTHYPLLEAAVNQVAQTLWPHPIKLVDAAMTMAQAAQQQLLAAQLQNPVRSRKKSNFFVTDQGRVAEIGSNFLGSALPGLHVITL